jgi:flagellar FliL protein
MGKLGLILTLVNTLAIAAVLGLFVYAKVIYKRPAITESKERARLESKAHQEEVLHSSKRGLITLNPMTANLDPYTDTDGQKKVHYVSLTLSIEVRDEKEIPKFEDIKPVIQDQIIQQLGKRTFQDLNQVQGRYLFRSLIIDATNAYLKEPVVTEVYFSDFLLQ